MVTKLVFGFLEGVDFLEKFRSDNPGSLDHCPIFVFVPNEGDRTMQLAVYFPTMVSEFTKEEFEDGLKRIGIEYIKTYVKGDDYVENQYREL